jgi:Tfp pilus assembly protein FimT
MCSSSKGSATAELAVLLPLLSVVIWLASAIGNAQLAQLGNLTAAASMVRAIQLDYSSADLDALARRLAVSYTVESKGDGLICVEAGSNGGGVLFASDARQHSCGVVPAR